MKEFLVTFQLVVSILLTLVILSQEKGTGLSTVFGGQGGSFQHSKRGAERVLAIMTVILAVLFIATSFAFIFVP